MKTDDWTDDFEACAYSYYRSGGGSWDAVRYMECLPDWNCIPLANFSPDLINDPSNCVTKPFEP